MGEFMDWEYEYKSVDEIVERGDEVGVIECCDFEILVNVDGTLSLRDLQGVGLGNIESERFKDYEDVLNRMTSYLHDYGFVRIGD